MSAALPKDVLHPVASATPSSSTPLASVPVTAGPIQHTHPSARDLREPDPYTSDAHEYSHARLLDERLVTQALLRERITSSTRARASAAHLQFVQASMRVALAERARLAALLAHKDALLTSTRAQLAVTLPKETITATATVPQVSTDTTFIQPPPPPPPPPQPPSSSLLPVNRRIAELSGEVADWRNKYERLLVELSGLHARTREPVGALPATPLPHRAIFSSSSGLQTPAEHATPNLPPLLAGETFDDAPGPDWPTGNPHTEHTPISSAIQTPSQTPVSASAGFMMSGVGVGTTDAARAADTSRGVEVDRILPDAVTRVRRKNDKALLVSTRKTIAGKGTQSVSNSEIQPVQSRVGEGRSVPEEANKTGKAALRSQKKRAMDNIIDPRPRKSPRFAPGSLRGTSTEADVRPPSRRERSPRKGRSRDQAAGDENLQQTTEARRPVKRSAPGSSSRAEAGKQDEKSKNEKKKSTKNSEGDTAAKQDRKRRKANDLGNDMKRGKVDEQKEREATEKEKLRQSKIERTRKETELKDKLQKERLAKAKERRMKRDKQKTERERLQPERGANNDGVVTEKEETANGHEEGEKRTKASAGGKRKKGKERLNDRAKTSTKQSAAGAANLAAEDVGNEKNQTSSSGSALQNSNSGEGPSVSVKESEATTTAPKGNVKGVVNADIGRRRSGRLRVPVSYDYDAEGRDVVTGSGVRNERVTRSAAGRLASGSGRHIRFTDETKGNSGEQSRP